MHAALGDLFSCIGAGDVTTTKALLCSKDEEERVTLLSGTNLSGITLLQHACHTGQSEGVSMLLDQVWRTCYTRKSTIPRNCEVPSNVPRMC